MKILLALVAVGEAATGLVLLVYPPILVQLLFGAEIAGVGVVISHIAGISLIALGLACWPDDIGDIAAPALRGLFTYNTLVTGYLVYLGIGGEWSGRLLWPAALVHAVLTILLVYAWFKERKSPKANT